MTADPRATTSSADVGVLTYCSRENTAGMSGWQVVYSSPDLVESELVALRSWVTTSFPGVDELPRFPDADALYGFPRRLLYTRMGSSPDAPRGMWHAFPAGSDTTGRPGNVFTHAILDRRPDGDAEGPLPIETWRSPDFQVPFGAEAVRDIAPPVVGVPRAGGYVTRERVAQYLFDPEESGIDELAVLLDAVAAVVAGELRGIVLGTASPDSAAMWIGAMSFLTSSTMARGITFCTLDTVAAVETVLDKGVHVVCVPDDQLHSRPEFAGCVVLSEGEAHQIGSPGAHHRTAGGHSVPAGPWSTLARGLVSDVESGTEVLRAVAGIEDRCGPSRSLAWPLAMVVASRREAWPALGEVARGALLDEPPAGLSRSKGDLAAGIALMSASASASTSASGHGTTDELWQQLFRAERVNPGGSAAALVAPAYLRRALADPSWLSLNGGLYYLARRRGGDWAGPELISVIEEATRSLRTPPPSPETFLKTLALIDAASLSGLLESSIAPQVTKAMRELAQLHVAPVWATDDHKFRGLRPLDPVAVRQVIAPLLVDPSAPDTGAPPVRLGAHTAQWLGMGRKGVVPESGDSSETARATRRVAIGAAARLLTEDPYREDVRDLRYDIVDSDADRSGGIPGGPVFGDPVLHRALFAAPWRLDQLLDLWRSGRVTVDPDSVAMAALCSGLDQMGGIEEYMATAGRSATRSTQTVFELAVRQKWAQLDYRRAYDWSKDLHGVCDLIDRCGPLRRNATRGWIGPDLGVVALYRMIRDPYIGLPVPTLALESIRLWPDKVVENCVKLIAKTPHEVFRDCDGQPTSQPLNLVTILALGSRDTEISRLGGLPEIPRRLADLRVAEELPDAGAPIGAVEKLAAEACRSVPMDYWDGYIAEAARAVERYARSGRMSAPPRRELDRMVRQALRAVLPPEHQADSQNRRSR